MTLWGTRVNVAPPAHMYPVVVENHGRCEWWTVNSQCNPGRRSATRGGWVPPTPSEEQRALDYDSSSCDIMPHELSLVDIEHLSSVANAGCLARTIANCGTLFHS